MPGTATQLYPADKPLVNGYRSVRTDSGLVGAGLRTGRLRLAWGWQERVHCTSAWFSQCLPSRSFRKLFHPTLADEATAFPSVVTWGIGFERGTVLMRAGTRAIIGAAGSAGLHGGRRRGKA